MEIEIFGEKTSQHLQSLKQVIGKSTQTYPRLHSSVSYVVKEITNVKNSKERIQLVSQVMKTLFNEHFFNEEHYFTLKSSYRPKFLHISLKFWETLAQMLFTKEEKNSVKEKML